MSNKPKYVQLVLEVLGAVQRSSTNPLEKDLLGAVISVESNSEGSDIGSEREAKPMAPALASNAVPTPALALNEAPSQAPSQAPDISDAKPVIEASPDDDAEDELDVEEDDQGDDAVVGEDRQNIQ